MLWASRILFPDASGYAPIEAAQLSRYAFFRWLGLFAVRGASPGGARDFLRAVERILTTPGAMLWITPEGRFVDVRERPVRFSSGLAHAAVRHPGASFVPLAVEYTFKKERLPEIFLRFGTVQTGRVWGSSVEEAKSRMEDGLRQTEDSLAEDVIAGRRDQFNRLFSGASGTAFPYDGWRRARAWVRGERIELNHSVDL
jgi:hypothetical protein